MFNGNRDLTRHFCIHDDSGGEHRRLMETGYFKHHRPRCKEDRRSPSNVSKGAFPANDQNEQGGKV